MALPQIYEGTAAEIAEKLRVSNLTGRLKAIVTSEEIIAQHGSTDSPDLANMLTDFLVELDKTEFTPGKPHSDPHEREVGRLIAEKFARQGHTGWSSAMLAPFTPWSTRMTRTVPAAEQFFLSFPRP